MDGKSRRRGIKDMPMGERPMERLVEFGPEAVSTAELIAVIIRCGMRGESAVDVGNRVIGTVGSPRRLATAGLLELAAIPGIGPVRAAQIKASIELGRRLLAGDGETRVGVGSPGEAASLLMPAMRYLDREEFRAIFLDTRNRVIDTATISIGSLNSSIVHPREVFREAIRAASAGIILAHNHPSGDPSPSPDDIAITQRLARAGSLLGIEVLDHIIIGDNAFVSFKDKGLLGSG
ncbi:MAG: DNA repair protein RadC [Firmicutes bacterium]|jgi:DNA repair protein RadC|nr:DNA repair protein RadC [Bacillota bacterium]